MRKTMKSLIVPLVTILAIAWGGTALAQLVPGKVTGILYGSTESFAEFHGFVTLAYYDFEEEGTRSGDSTFDQHYFYFNAIAKIRQNVTVFGEVEYEHGGEELSLDRAFIDWGLHGEHMNLRMGKFYSPFGLELREYQYPVRKMTSRPLMTRNLLFNEWTETGLNFYGRLGNPTFSVDYDVAVVNGPNGDDSDADGTPEIMEVGTSSNPNTGGTGDAKQNRDNNNSRTVIGRVSASIPAGVVVGVSYAGGRYSDTGSPELDFTLTGADINFRMMGLDIRGEWAARTIDLDPTTEVDSNSFYAQVSYKVQIGGEGIEYIEPVVRYDTLEPDKDTKDDERTRTTIGINYAPYPHFKFMAEWQMN
ncbi:MAG: hypothetical protein HY349_01645, partial [Nitrospirae bacterium]|nr:hypothetical protein [Nitrospirota bacterium]